MQFFFFCLALSIFTMVKGHCQYGIVIHGGAGMISSLPEEKEEAYRSVLDSAVMAGYQILEQGGTATEAVIKAITILEDSPLFNAGKGSVLNREGFVEMDASIMEGKGLRAGAVAGVRTIRNPIQAAYQVMVNSPHVLLIGEGADAWAKKIGLKTEPPDYFIIETRKKQWEKRGEIQLDHEAEWGTVGAVALDKEGNIVAGTSTGGMHNKWVGRVGDSPLIGAGTYADNRFGGISCTGHGEYFIRHVVAYDIIAQVRYQGKSLQEAAQAVLERLEQDGGRGGIIGLDPHGNVLMLMNTSGMYRAYAIQPQKGEFQKEIKIFADE